MKYNNIIKELENRIEQLENQRYIEEYDSHKDFPQIGVSNRLYIDITDNILYRWDSNSQSYIAFNTIHHQGHDHIINAVEVTEDVLSVVCPIAGTAMSIGEKVVEELEEHIHKK